MAAASSVPDTSAGVSRVHAAIAAATSSAVGASAMRATSAGSCGRKAKAAPKPAAMASASKSRRRRALRRSGERLHDEESSRAAELQARAAPRRVASSAQAPRHFRARRVTCASAIAKQRSDQDIAGEVDACVDARVRHDGGEGSQGQGEPGLGGCGSGRKRKRGRRMARRKRARSGHAHVPRDERPPLRAPPSPEWLQRSVHHHRGDGDRRQPVEGGAPAAAAAAEREQSCGADPDPRVIGRMGYVAHGAVERRYLGTRDGGVHREVGALGVPQPVAQRSQAGDPMMRRRLLAVAALLLTPLAVVSVVGLVVEDPQDAFGVLLTLSLALVAAGYGLVRRGIVRVIALVLAGMLLLGVLEVLLDRRVLDRLTIVGLFWLAVAAAAAAFAVHVPLPRASRPQRPVLFLNPRSGGGKAERFKLADEARKRGIEPIELGPGDDLATLVKTAVDEGADALAMAGGRRVAGRGRRGRGRARSPVCLHSVGNPQPFRSGPGRQSRRRGRSARCVRRRGRACRGSCRGERPRLREQRLARPLRDRGAARWLSKRETAHDPRHPPGRARAAWAAPGPPVDRPSRCQVVPLGHRAPGLEQSLPTRGDAGVRNAAADRRRRAWDRRCEVTPRFPLAASPPPAPLATVVGAGFRGPLRQAGARGHRRRGDRPDGPPPLSHQACRAARAHRAGTPRRLSIGHPAREHLGRLAGTGLDRRRPHRPPGPARTNRR